MFILEGVREICVLPPELLNKLIASYGSLKLTELDSCTDHTTVKHFSYPWGLLKAAPNWVGDLCFDIDPAVANECAVYLRDNYFQYCTYAGCVITELTPGFTLKKHRDIRLVNIFSHRIQVPITCADSVYGSRNKEFKLEVGKAYETDNIGTHYAINSSQTSSKISLLIDLMPTDIYEEELATGKPFNRQVLFDNSKKPI